MAALRGYILFFFLSFLLLPKSKHSTKKNLILEFRETALNFFFSKNKAPVYGPKPFKATNPPLNFEEIEIGAGVVQRSALVWLEDLNTRFERIAVDFRFCSCRA
ncbi:hypothetical protein V6Z11_1Z114400 [Gossypium hirsutum]